MEGRPPFEPEDDLDFDFDSPRRRQAEREQRPEGDTGERPRFDEEAPDEQAPEPPSEEAEPGERPHETDSDSYAEQPSSAEHSTSGEYPAVDPFDTGERRVRRREPKRRGLRLPRIPGRRSRRDERKERPARASETGEGDEPPTTGERARLSEDPFETPEAAAARRERRHHRDLPAKVRRRQAAGIGAIALVVLLGGYLLVKAVGGGGGDEEQPLALKRLVGQTIIGKLPQGGPDKELLRRVKKGQLGGVIAVNPQNEETLAQQVAQLQSAAAAGDSPPLLVMIDQEGGEVKRLPGPPDVAPSSLGDTGDPEAARTVGEDTGNYLKGAGVNVNLAPVMDVRLDQTADTIADRTYSDDPAVVSEIGSAFLQGMQSTGIAATAKHFPGLGPATVNTDFAPTEIVVRDTEILDAALQPFQAAVDAGVELVMVASASYPDYGPENPKDPNKPANAVKAIVQKQLQENLGFQGLVITDDLESIAIEELTSPTAAGVAALGAGCDLILYAKSIGASEQALVAAVKAVKQEKLSRDQLQASYDSILSLKQRLDPDGD